MVMTDATWRDFILNVGCPTPQLPATSQ